MILTLFLALLALSAFVVFLGYYTDDEPYLTVGLFFLFLLSIVILTGNLQYQTGDTKTSTFSYTAGLLTSETDVTTYNYTTWNDDTSHKVGWGLAIASFLGVALSLYNMKKGIDDG